VKLQRLLDEGLFVASYKFALLRALADLSTERGGDSGAPLPITTEQIAGKFIHYYWRQAVPYAALAEVRVLRQNTGKQAPIVNIVQAARQEHGDSLAAVMNNASLWKPLVREVERLQQRAWVEQRIAQLQQLIDVLKPMANAPDQGPTQRTLPQLCLFILSLATEDLSVPQIRDHLRRIGVVLDYQNELAVLHTIMGRLEKSGYVRSVRNQVGSRFRITGPGKQALMK
jgi:hypothetical protein